MINYATYEFYKDTYKGTLSNDLFTSLIVKASREIDKNVNREIKEEDLDNSNFADKIRFTACELVDFINANSNTNANNNVSSISIDGVSKTYKTQTLAEAEKEKRNIIDGLPQELTRCL